MTAYGMDKGKPGGMDRRLLKGLGIVSLLCALIAWQLLSQLFWQAALGFMVMAVALPICRLLEKKIPRSWAATLSMLALSGIMAALFLLLMPLIWRQGRQLAQMAPSILQGIRDWLTRLQTWMQNQGIPLNADAQEMVFDNAQSMVGSALAKLVALAGGWAQGLSKVFLAPVFAFYFLRDREELAQRASLWVPLKYRRKAVAVAREMRREVSGFWRGQLLISGYTGALTALGLLIVGVPAWLLLGLLMGILELVPYIGPFLGAIPVLLFSLPMGLGRAAWAMGVVLVVQQLEGSMFSPHLMSGATRLHPIAVLMAISAGGLVGGVAGMLLAVPIVVSVRGALRTIRKGGVGA